MHDRLSCRWSSMFTLAGALLVVCLAAGSALAGDAAWIPKVTVDAQCVDNAVPIAGNRNNKGEPSIKVTQGRQDRWKLATWTEEASGSESPISEKVVLAQLGPDGKRLQETLAHDYYGDAWLDTSPSGDAYVSYMTLSGSTGTPDTASTNVQIRHINPGHAADAALPAPPGMFDHPSIAVDQLSLEHDRLYFVGSDLFGFREGYMPGLLSISDNGARSWSQMTRFPARLLGFNRDQAGSAVASGGESTVVAWVEGKYDKKGNGIEAAVRVAPVDRRSSGFDKATTLAISPGGWVTSLGFGASVIPSLSVVRAGERKGRAYVVWPVKSDAAETSHSDVYLSYSDNAGVSWSKPVMVNDDRPGESYHVYPSVVARPDGTAYVAWMDSRDDPTGKTALLYGAVVDGSARRGANLRLTNCPTYAEHNYSMGDYFNFDTIGNDPVIAFPNIRKERGPSDVFLLDMSSGL